MENMVHMLYYTGVGKDQLGLMLTNMKIKKHNFIDKPYAIAYTAGHDRDKGPY